MPLGNIEVVKVTASIGEKNGYGRGSREVVEDKREDMQQRAL